MTEPADWFVGAAGGLHSAEKCFVSSGQGGRRNLAVLVSAGERCRDPRITDRSAKGV
jgi:hypothetical protein